MRSPVELQKELVCIDVELKSLIREILSCGDLDGVSRKNREASDAMHKMNRMIREIGNLAEAAPRVNREEMMSLVDTYRKVQLDNQSALRRANVTAQKALDNKQRSELFHTDAIPGREDGIRKRGKMESEVLVRSSGSVNANLLTISRIMSDQVQSSNTALSQLEETSSRIVENCEEAKSMGNVIHQSSKLLTKYDRRETTDKILIFFSFLFFYACVFYVIKKRAGIPFSWVWSWLF
ncbi:vesicle transport protein SEC20 [Galendromus occidentalis]|uniref:Vesicle transport protein SEC20 n=1 Tax=Galendromus occidentalis TaxID=34638 RepID=A0AAJ6QYJ1_9ACAR|nr:vesicle transport protein SEC20 [Galendromus occidentalis]